MATVKVKAEGKSGFLKEFFVDHPDAGKSAINEAWREAGNEGTISDSLTSKIRRDLGLTEVEGRKDHTQGGRPHGEGERQARHGDSGPARRASIVGGGSDDAADPAGG
jgi:hypothetical protein